MHFREDTNDMTLGMALLVVEMCSDEWIHSPKFTIGKHKQEVEERQNQNLNASGTTNQNLNSSVNYGSQYGHHLFAYENENLKQENAQLISSAKSQGRQPAEVLLEMKRKFLLSDQAKEVSLHHQERNTFFNEHILLGQFLSFMILGIYLDEQRSQSNGKLVEIIESISISESI